MFVDKASITVRAGNGGHGCCSFRREKFIPRGGPDGGDGGDGGNVVFRSSVGEQSLVDYVYTRHFAAANGIGGKGKNLHGRRADDLELVVPAGTVISDAETGEVLADLDMDGMTFVAAYGGKGGRGNPRFVTRTNRAPHECEAGGEGEVRKLSLELKTIADIGLVGYPNAGKSTLLRAVSSARPKVAPYPFTTLHPVVGVVEYPDYTTLTVADIPGLIDGAHENIGLGHAFLKHIERTSVLAVVLDTAGVDNRKPWEDYFSLMRELELYMRGLSSRPKLVVANKMDLPESAANLEILRGELSAENVSIIPVAADRRELGSLTALWRDMVKAASNKHF